MKILSGSQYLGGLVGFGLGRFGVGGVEDLLFRRLQRPEEGAEDDAVQRDGRRHQQGTCRMPTIHQRKMKIKNHYNTQPWFQ